MTQMTSAEPLTIEAHAPGKYLNMNDRPRHWAPHARLIETWRTWAHLNALSQLGRNCRPGPSVITVELAVPDRRRRDPHNYHPTLKAIVDGITSAGLWPDDTPEWVSVAEPRLIVRRDHLVRIVIEPMSPALPPTFAGEPINGSEGTQTPDVTHMSKESQ